MSKPRARTSRVATPPHDRVQRRRAPHRNPSAPHAAPDALARARWLLMGLFALNGLTFSSWIARLPSVRDALDLSTGELGAVLLAGSVGSLATGAVAGVVVARFGARRTLHVSSFGFVAAYVLLGVGPATGSLPVLVGGIFLVGVSFALGNVPLNVESAVVERGLGRTVLPQFHAAFSIGAVVGSGLGALASHLGLPVLIQFSGIAVLGLAWRLVSIPHVVLAPASVRLPLGAGDPGASGSTRALDASTPASDRAGRPPGAFASALDAWREPRTLLIGIVILSAALSEGAANDWLPLAVVDGFRRTEAVGALALSGFVGAMTAVRLLGTRLIDRHGRVRVLRGSSLTSLVGLIVFGTAPTLWIAGLGVVCWGFGAALAFPLGIAAASDDPMRAAARVSVVSAFASVASIAAPPLLGLAAQSMGARHALMLIAGAMVASVLFARSLAPDEAHDVCAGTDRAPGTDLSISSASSTPVVHGMLDATAPVRMHERTMDCA